MTAVQFNYQQIKFCDFPEIHLDNIDERCGEIYITLGGTLVFHCSLCGSNYGSINSFLDHLAAHYKDVEEEVNENDVKQETDKLFQEQKFDNVDANDKNIDEYEAILQIEEVASSNLTNSEQIVAESKESDTEEIKDEIEIEEQTSGTWNLEGNNTRTKARRRCTIKVGEFICKECGKKFRTNQYLRKHSVIHSDKRRYKCKICDHAFKDWANCRSHMRRCHFGTNKVECGYCPKKFFTQNEARNHRRIHTGERFTCSICDKAYTSSYRLKSHKCRTFFALPQH